MYNLTGIRKFFQAFFVLVILARMLFSSVTINQTVYASPTEAPSNSANQLLGSYGNHDMTGVGYEQYDDGNNTYKYVIVHDTWSSTTTNVYLYLPTLSWNETVRVIPK